MEKYILYRLSNWDVLLHEIALQGREMYRKLSYEEIKPLTLDEIYDEDIC
jgi:hypothetical protein